MNSNWKDSVVLIISSDSKNQRFGTGFIIHQDSNDSYVLTCDHVIKEVGGQDNVVINNVKVKQVISGEKDGIDLSVIRIEGLSYKFPLKLRLCGEKGIPVLTCGFQIFNKQYLSRPLEGKLGNQIEITKKDGTKIIEGWDLIIDDYQLQPGYSGSPVIEKTEESVVGIVSHRIGEGEKGIAISVEMLRKVWTDMPHDLLNPPELAKIPVANIKSDAKQIYIIAAKDDRRHAKRLYDDLKKVGLNVWMESEDLDAGGNVDLIVRKNIRNSAYILALLSSNAFSKRGLVHKELKIALDVFDEYPPDRIFLIPVKIDDCDIYEPRLESLRAVDLFESYQDGLKQILRSIEKQGILKPETSESDNQMKKIDKDLENKLSEIERLYESAEFQGAYRKFKDICSSYPAYRDSAVSILSRFNDLNNQIMLGIIRYEDQAIEKQKIGNAFLMCLKRFKEEHLI